MRLVQFVRADGLAWTEYTSDKAIEYGTQDETARLYKGRGVKFNNSYRYVLTTRNDGTITIKVENGYCNISADKGEY